MPRRITIIQGHPDAQARHFGHAPADDYAKGGGDGGREVQCLEVAGLECPLLRTKEEFEHGRPLLRYQSHQKHLDRDGGRDER